MVLTAPVMPDIQPALVKQALSGTHIQLKTVVVVAKERTHHAAKLNAAGSSINKSTNPWQLANNVVQP